MANSPTTPKIDSSLKFELKSLDDGVVDTFARIPVQSSFTRPNIGDTIIQSIHLRLLRI